MFTGLIEEIGRVRRVDRRGRFQQLEIAAVQVLEGLRIGDSVNIDGACQTVVATDAAGFRVETVEETLRRTTLGELETGDAVNLERALRADSRLGGHMVLGHVDGVGRVARLAADAGSWTLEIEPPTELRRYLAAKGSVAVHGISLTIARSGEQAFTVAVIPHTFEHTTLSQHRVGSRVNLEVDVIARYVERLLHGGSEAPGALTLERLREMGY